MTAPATMVVTIDGPAGSGKSSVARRVAERLGFRYLDTGAMYRALTLAGLERGWNWADGAEAARAAARVRLEWDGDRIFVDGRDVSGEIRSQAVASHIHLVADNPLIRAHLVRLQRQQAERGPLVTEGRDQGTVVFPDSRCKFFLTAAAAERARRRLEDIQRGDAGDGATFDETLQWIEDRDRRDRSRPVGALAQASDALVVDTTGRSPDEVVEELVRVARERLEQS